MRFVFAGGHEEQPWLVKSSTTTGDLSVALAGADNPTNADAARTHMADFLDCFMALLPIVMPVAAPHTWKFAFDPGLLLALGIVTKARSAGPENCSRQYNKSPSSKPPSPNRARES